MKIKGDRSSSVSLLAVSSVALQILFAMSALGGQYSTDGKWGDVLIWDYDDCIGGAFVNRDDGTSISIHTHVLPTGFVMIYPLRDCPRLWNPLSESDPPVDLSGVGFNAFCGGHSHIPDGRLLLSGGNVNHDAPAFPGHRHAAYFNPFDPFNNAWTPLPDMGPANNEYGRWYPSSTTLASGDVLVAAGFREDGSTHNDLPQVWEVANNTWRNLTSARTNLPLYPRTFLAPNGKVFFATSPSRFLDTAGAGAWSGGYAPLFPGHGNNQHDYVTPACMDHTGKVYWLGGSENCTCAPTANCEMIDLNAASPQWIAINPMPQARKHHNATILPNGKFLVTGGTYTPTNGNDGGKSALLYDPVANTWAELAPEAGYRGYHSTAVLLPDGRVLSSGGNQPPDQSQLPDDDTNLCERNAQIFSPPYLFNGDEPAVRPTITSAPAEVGYSQTFFVATDDAATIEKVTWTRIGSATHSFNWDQRINVLCFSLVAGGLNVTAPGSPNLCPPGYYMLWILNASGVPSVSKMVRVRATTIIDLGVLPSCNKSLAYGISDSARVAGSCLAGPGYPRAFRTGPNAPINPATDDLGAVLNAVFGTGFTQAYDIGNSNANTIRIIGDWLGSSGSRAFYRYEGPGSSETLLLPMPSGGSATYARGMHLLSAGENGGIAGWARVGYHDHAMYWSIYGYPANPGWYDYGAVFFPGVNSYGMAIHNNYFVGYKNSGSSRAFMLHNGSITYLDGPAGITFSEAYGVIGDGQTVGVYRCPGDRAVVWRYLGTPGSYTSNLLPIPLGYTRSTARGINDHGVVVGYFWNVANPTQTDYRAFIYSCGVSTDLNALLPPNSGWTLHAAYKINNAGKIVGYGSYNGQIRAFLMTP